MELAAVPLVIGGIRTIEMAVRAWREPKERIVIEQQLMQQNNDEVNRAYRLAYDKLQSDENFRTRMLQMFEQKEKHERDMQMLALEMEMMGQDKTYALDEQHLKSQHAISMASLDVQRDANQLKHSVHQIGVSGKLNNDSLEILLRNAVSMNNQTCLLITSLLKNEKTASDGAEKIWEQIEKMQSMSANLANVALSFKLEREELTTLQELYRQLEKSNAEFKTKIAEQGNENLRLNEKIGENVGQIAGFINQMNKMQKQIKTLEEKQQNDEEEDESEEEYGYLCNICGDEITDSAWFQCQKCADYDVCRPCKDHLVFAPKVKFKEVTLAERQRGDKNYASYLQKKKQNEK